MVKKPFFRERNVEEIRDLKPRQVSTQRKLVAKIEDLEPDRSMIWRFRLTPGRFFTKSANSAEASRKNLKHGNYIALEQPQNLQEALEGGVPLQYRISTLGKLKGREEEIDVVGFSRRPIMGNDRRKILTPFYIGPEGARIFAYSEHVKDLKGALKDTGIKEMPYADAKRVAREGGEIVCLVPSREAKKPRYQLRFVNFPLDETLDREHNPRAIIWGLKAEYQNTPENEFWFFGYTPGEARKSSDVIVAQPQEVAAYIALAGKYWKEAGNTVPMAMNPFALSSQRQAEFYKKLRNNILVYDPTLTSKDKLRKPHLDEISTMLARQLSVAGHDETMFWDWNRDGKLKDYNWQQGK